MGDIRHILIVEDDAAFADFLRIAIESLGHRATVVGSGGTALDAFREAKPDLVFLDLLLPQRDGFKVCEDIRKETSGARLPVVMMTGIYKKPSFEKDALERLKVAEYLVKPFGVREVWRAIEKLLGPSSLKGSCRVEAPTATGWSLQESPLACQLSEHLRLKSDGVMFVRGADATFVLYVRDGAPMFIRSSDPSDRLDRVVARTTRIAETALADCVREASDSRGRKRLGDVLLERKLLSRDELEIALQLQLRLILNRAFALDKGCCLFVAGEHPTEEDVVLQGNPRALLVRGARATAPALVRAHLPPSSSVIVRAEGWEALVPDLGLKEDEVRLLQLCDGATTVERFLATASVAGYDGHRILLALLCSGLVTDVPYDRAPVRRPAASAPPIDATQWRARPLGALVSELYRRAESGRLEAVVAAGEAPKVMHFRDGEIVAVSSEADADRLAAMLLQMQVVEPVALDEVVEALGRGASDALLVRTLVDRQMLSPTEGYWAAVYQAHGAVHDILRCVPLDMSWTPGDLDPSLTTLPDVPTIELALNGVRGLDAATVGALLPPPDWKVVARRDLDARGTPLSGGELAIFNRLAMGQGLGAFCSLAEDPATRARAVLALMQLGLVDAEAPTAAPAPEVDTAAPLPLDDTDGEVDAGSEAPLDPIELEDALLAENGVPPLTAASDPSPAPASTPAATATPPAQASGTKCAMTSVVERLADLSADSDVDDDEAWMTLTATVPPARASTASQDGPARPAPARAVTDDTVAPEAQAVAEELRRRLAALRPTLQALRGGFAGDERRVAVDRASMAELLDEMLALVALARGLGEPARRDERDPVGAR